MYKNGQKVLYLKVLHAIYGFVESYLQWYNLYALTLKGLCFNINTYNRCLLNNMVDRNQCDFVWYVDDNKLSHIDPNLVTNILNILKEHFGGIVISRRRKQYFWA